MTRGQLRVYLGAAPGVGKTFAMLDEARRRRERGADVVVGVVETHGRPRTASKLAGMEIVARRLLRYRGGEYAEMDLAAVLARAPQVALVDELAHTNVPGSEHEKRWQDVQALLDSGIDVISTVNIQHLESLNDVVEAITGVPQRETLPDAIVRAAEQVELVDMTPEALRRRMAHGNIYAPDKIDAALGNYFRIGNLTALRELALLWLADSVVEEGMQHYRELHGITATWETRERIVVALTGGPEGDTLLRRGARIAARATGGDLLAVHVARSDGLAGASIASLDRQRLLVESLGGSYHSVIGDDVGRAVLDFARGANATQIVIGASRRHPIVAALTGAGTGAAITRQSGSIDVHVVTHDYIGHSRALPHVSGGVTRRRQFAGVLVGGLLLALLTDALTAMRSQLSFTSDLCLYLLVIIVISLIGGFYPALAAAVVGSLLLNYYFAPPIHTLTIDERNNVIAVAIFVLVSLMVSRVVDLAARRLAIAGRASAEAESLSTLAGSLLRGERALPALLQRVQETFGMRAVSLLGRQPGEPQWEVLASVGQDAPATPTQADCVAEIDDERLLAASGRTLRAEDQRVLTAFAAQVAVAYQQRELAAAASAVAPLAESDRARTALLNAVGHDLRTPIAAAKAAVSSLRAGDVVWRDEQRRELLATADDALDRLTDLVTNLLDLSRLQAGVLPVTAEPLSVVEVLASAADHARVVDCARVEVRVPDDLPEVLADAGLLDRVLANLLQNAARYAPPDEPVILTASAHANRVEVRVIDRGPGIAFDDAERVFAPFQRHNDAPTSGAGVGLGLAIARGFAAAMGGGVTTEITPGGGATFVVTLPAYIAFAQVKQTPVAASPVVAGSSESTHDQPELR